MSDNPGCWLTSGGRAGELTSSVLGFCGSSAIIAYLLSPAKRDTLQLSKLSLTSLIFIIAAVDACTCTLQIIIDSWIVQSPDLFISPRTFCLRLCACCWVVHSFACLRRLFGRREHDQHVHYLRLRGLHHVESHFRIQVSVLFVFNLHSHNVGCFARSCCCPSTSPCPGDITSSVGASPPLSHSPLRSTALSIATNRNSRSAALSRVFRGCFLFLLCIHLGGV